MRIISILFTEYTDFVSRLVYHASGGGCTHVSIALDEENEYFYSFNTKGFRREYPKKHKNRTKESVCFKLEIAEECFQKLKQLIEKFESKKEEYKYNWLGVVLLFLRIPCSFKKHFYCSQFVTYILKEAKVIKWKRHFSMYFPNQIMKELKNCPKLKEIIYNPVPKII